MSRVLTLSTAWNVERAAGWAAAAADLVARGFNHVALDGPVLYPDAAGAAASVRAAKGSIDLLFAPSPFAVNGGRLSSAAAVGLSSPREEARADALRVALRAAACAADARTGTVVLRAGGIGDPAAWDEHLRRGGPAAELASDVHLRREEQSRHRHRALDATCRALHLLCRAHPDVSWLLETPSAVCGLPWPEEIGLILAELPGRRLGYWHDTAHAARLDALGAIAAESWLEAAGDVTHGVTLSDWSPSASGLPPGAGTADFASLRPQLTPRMTRVLALSPTLPAAFLDEAVRQAEGI